MILFMGIIFYPANAFGSGCPEYKSGDPIAWLNSVEDHTICNIDESFLTEVNKQMSARTDWPSIRRVAGYIQYAPGVFAMDVASKTEAYRRDSRVRASTTLNGSLEARAYLCYLTSLIQTWVPFWCEGGGFEHYAIVNGVRVIALPLEDTIYFAKDMGINQFDTYISGHEFDPIQAKKVQEIFRRAAKRAKNLERYKMSTFTSLAMQDK
jgi:hypothetical protein